MAYSRMTPENVASDMLIENICAFHIRALMALAPFIRDATKARLTLDAAAASNAAASSSRK